MKTTMTVLRGVAGALSLFFLLWSAVLLIVPFFWPVSIVPVIYFALCLFGIFALLPRRHCWLSATFVHGASFVFLCFFCPRDERLLYFSGFFIYAALWWSSVGYASLKSERECA